eukprot:CAMPEP_0202085842 /NCGR_PEP_ID=MMETSP0964-20121228/31830_1 /ASSEMBLY_ACC=CAM_ASM_000500 /TAXON_ID=4773 /ORGANISM="Schizochytrium aggregatum, Strain ATCC28209" /LENGTH=356 /DNA_ID=CAMNT_0048653697 /DNA_START=50 /DNA_END=1120 /DNA_ORIENTATION=-
MAENKADRAAGVVLGVLIGDALGMGSHWIYDADEFKKLYGWQTDYVEPTEGRYHHGALRAGQLTQSGELSARFAATLAECDGYDRDHFTGQWDEMLAEMDGTRTGGRHGWTNKDMCDLYKRRVVQKKEWGRDTASPTTDTTDSIVRAALAAARYYHDLPKMIDIIREQAELQYKDVGVITQSICFGCVVAAIINGDPIDEHLSDKLYKAAQDGKLPFTFLSGERDDEENLAEPDGLLLISMIVRAAKDAEVGGQIDSHLGPRLYGLACAWFMSLPSSYWCAAKHPESFEDAMLAAINAGGQNVARGSFVGAMLGARVGLAGIPDRFVSGLHDSENIVAQARKIAADAQAEEDMASK